MRGMAKKIIPVKLSATSQRYCFGSEARKRFLPDFGSSFQPISFLFSSRWVFTRSTGRNSPSFSRSESPWSTSKEMKSRQPRRSFIKTEIKNTWVLSFCDVGTEKYTSLHCWTTLSSWDYLFPYIYRGRRPVCRAHVQYALKIFGVIRARRIPACLRLIRENFPWIL